MSSPIHGRSPVQHVHAPAEAAVASGSVQKGTYRGLDVQFLKEFKISFIDKLVAKISGNYEKILWKQSGARLIGAINNTLTELNSGVRKLSPDDKEQIKHLKGLCVDLEKMTKNGHLGLQLKALESGFEFLEAEGALVKYEAIEGKFIKEEVIVDGHGPAANYAPAPQLHRRSTFGEGDAGRQRASSVFAPAPARGSGLSEAQGDEYGRSPAMSPTHGGIHYGGYLDGQVSEGEIEYDEDGEEMVEIDTSALDQGPQQPVAAKRDLAAEKSEKKQSMKKRMLEHAKEVRAREAAKSPKPVSPRSPTSPKPGVSFARAAKHGVETSKAQEERDHLLEMGRKAAAEGAEQDDYEEQFTGGVPETFSRAEKEAVEEKQAHEAAKKTWVVPHKDASPRTHTPDRVNAKKQMESARDEDYRELRRPLQKSKDEPVLPGSRSVSPLKKAVGAKPKEDTDTPTTSARHIKKSSERVQKDAKQRLDDAAEVGGLGIEEGDVASSEEATKAVRHDQFTGKKTELEAQLKRIIKDILPGDTLSSRSPMKTRGSEEWAFLKSVSYYEYSGDKKSKSLVDDSKKALAELTVRAKKNPELKAKLPELARLIAEFAHLATEFPNG